MGFKSEFEKNKTAPERLADWFTDSFGTIWFFNFNAIIFCLWILVNTGVIPVAMIFDPYPFGMLTMVVSLEAIFLSIIVLISQNRASQIADLREELDLEVNLWSEREVTKILNMLDEIHDHLGLSEKDDEELRRMKEVTNIKSMTEDLLRDLKK